MDNVSSSTLSGLLPLMLKKSVFVAPPFFFKFWLVISGGMALLSPVVLFLISTICVSPATKAANVKGLAVAYWNRCYYLKNCASFKLNPQTCTLNSLTTNLATFSSTAPCSPISSLSTPFPTSPSLPPAPLPSLPSRLQSHTDPALSAVSAVTLKFEKRSSSCTQWRDDYPFHHNCEVLTWADSSPLKEPHGAGAGEREPQRWKETEQHDKRDANARMHKDRTL